MTAYPPEPGHPHGEFLAGVFLVPLGELPGQDGTDVPSGARPPPLAGRAIVAVPVTHRRRRAVAPRGSESRLSRAEDHR